MFPFFTHFKESDFSFVSEQNNDLEYRKCVISTHYDEKHIVDPTAEGDLSDMQDFVTSKNPIVYFRNYEISFESNFLEEHKNAFKKETENFIELCFKEFDGKKITFESPQFLTIQLELSTLPVELLKLSNIDKMKEFLKQIEKHEKLNQFFTFLYQSHHRDLVNELMYLASVAYNRHISTRKIGENEADLLIKAKELSQSEYEVLFLEERINFLSLRNASSSDLNCQSTLQTAFKSYLEFFFTTVLLIADEYFANPYNECEEIKRNRSFGEEGHLEDKKETNFEGLSYGIGTKKSH